MIPSTNDLCRFFNFRFNPFSLTPDEEVFFPSRAHLESLVTLRYGIEHGSLISVLVGEPGTGKTQLLRTLFSELSEDVKVFVFDNSSLPPEEFYSSLMAGLNVVNKSSNFEPFNKDYILKKFREFIYDNNEEKVRKVLIVVDEAQFLPDKTLEELRFLTNLNREKEPRIQVLLAGQLSLEEKLRSERFLPVRQRISILEKLEPLEKDEVMPYVWYRIRAASDSPKIGMDRSVEKVLVKKSRCIPRIINKLMNRAIFLAYLRTEREITGDHIKEAEETLAKETV